MNDDNYSFYLAAETLAWLNKQVGYHDHQAWSEWRKFTADELMGGYQHPWYRQSVLSKAKTTGVKLTEEELIAKIKTCPDIAALLQSVELYLHLYPDGVLEKRIRQFWQNLIEAAELNTTYAASDPSFFAKKYDDAQLIAPLVTQKSWWPIRLIVISLMLNAALFWLGGLENIGSRFVIGNSGFNLCITLLIPIFLWFRKLWIINRTKDKLKPFYQLNPRILVKNNPWQLLTYLSIWGLDTSTIGSIYFSGADEYVSGSAILIYGVLKLAYYAWIYVNVSHKIPSSAEIVRVAETSRFLSTSVLNTEENEHEIMQAETKIEANSKRQEGYMLESALLGALAFGGSIQIASADSFNYAYSTAFISHIQLELIRFINQQADSLAFISNSFLTENGIQSWICLIGLICACFFLAVIAIRIQFNRFYEESSNHIKLAKFFNSRVGLKPEQNVERPSEHEIIRQHLRDGSLSIVKLEKTVEYMDFFRSLGIFSFFFIVFLTGIYLGKTGFLLLSFVLAGQWVYGNLAIIRQYRFSLRTKFEEFYIIHSTKVEVSLWSLYFLSTLWLSFIDGNSGVVFQTWVIVFSVLWLMLSTLFPDMEIEKWEGAQIGYQQSLLKQWLINKQFRLASFFFLLGLIFKITYTTGAAMLIVISMITTILGAIFTPKVKNNNKVLNVLAAITLSGFAMGVSFKFMAYGFADYLVIISLMFFVALLVYSKFNLSEFTKFTKRLLIVYCFLGFCILINTGMFLDLNPMAYLTRREVAQRAGYREVMIDSVLSTTSAQTRAECLKNIDESLELILPYIDHPNLKTQAEIAAEAFVAFSLTDQAPIKSQTLEKLAALKMHPNTYTGFYYAAFNFIDSAEYFNHTNDSIIRQRLGIKIER